MTILTPANASSFMRTYGKIESVPVNEVKYGIKIGLFGPGGIGKTTLAGTVCDSEFGWPVAYLDARGNPNVISSRRDKVQVFTIDTFRRVEEIRQDMLKDRDFPFRTIIIDNVSELHAIDLRDIYGPTRDIDWTMHSASTADVLQMTRNFCDMADDPRFNVNVVFVFWDIIEKRKIDFKEVERSELALNKALQSQVPGIVNWLGRVYIDDEKTYTRKLDFRPIESMHVAKHQADPDDEWAMQIPMEIWNPSLGTILDTLKGHVPFPKERHARPGRR